LLYCFYFLIEMFLHVIWLCVAIVFDCRVGGRASRWFIFRILIVSSQDDLEIISHNLAWLGTDVLFYWSVNLYSIIFYTFIAHFLLENIWLNHDHDWLLWSLLFACIHNSDKQCDVLCSNSCPWSLNFDNLFGRKFFLSHDTSPQLLSTGFCFWFNVLLFLFS
jgi:hypothetical protein